MSACVARHELSSLSAQRLDLTYIHNCDPTCSGSMLYTVHENSDCYDITPYVLLTVALSKAKFDLSRVSLLS